MGAARWGALDVARWEGGVTGRGLAVLREVALFGDGAAWIWHLADERFDARIEVVDPYHAYQHLHATARAPHGDGPDADDCVASSTAELLTEGAAPVLAALRAKAPTPEDAAALRTARGYFAANADRMNYPALRLDGLPLGSGAIKSAADHLLQRRMKRAGMRRSDHGGDAMLAPLARLRSRRPLIPAA